MTERNDEKKTFGSKGCKERKNEKEIFERKAKKIWKAMTK